MKTAILTLTCLLGLSMAAAAAQADDSPPAPTASPVAASAAPAPDAAPVAAGPATASPAAPAAPSEGDAVQTVGDLVQAVRSGQWRMAASLALGLLMLALGKVRGRIKWFSGDRGGAVLVGILAFAGALASALATSAPIDLKLFVGTLGVMWTAVGGYGWIKRMIWPQPSPDAETKPAASS